MSDTIFALASGYGRAGIAVLRISGPHAGAALRRLSGRPLPEPRRATLARLRAQDGDLLDEALALWFPAPGSYTGEDVAELHVHGGRAVLSGVIGALATLPGLRPAEAGEFTRRAFDNGRLDPTAAEGVADLIGAETPAQRRQALRQLGGELARLYDGWRTRLVRDLAYLEAEIDFADEDLPADTSAVTRSDLSDIETEIARHLEDGRRGEILRDGFSIAIIGPPNAGKSSLLNLIARRDVAIVAETAGTTRDVIETRLDLGGYPVLLADTAGLREAGEAVEAEGIRRARARAETADLRLVVLDATRPACDDATLRGPDSLVVMNKCDVARPAMAQGALAISVCTGEGVPELLSRIGERVRDRLGMQAEAPALTRVRHRQALEDCRSALRRGRSAPQPDLAAEDVRLAVRALGRITGRVDVEDLLDVIFRDFCIGK